MVKVTMATVMMIPKMLTSQSLYMNRQRTTDITVGTRLDIIGSPHFDM